MAKERPAQKPQTLLDKFWSAKEKRDKNKARLSDLEEAIQNNEKLLELRNSSHTLPPAKTSLEMVEGVVNSNFRRMIMALAKKNELANMMKKDKEGKLKQSLEVFENELSLKAEELEKHVTKMSEKIQLELKHAMGNSP